MSIPLGQRENQHLEFKGRDVFGDPTRVARAVVAMLNANGGTVWVGIAEHDGLASAIENIENPQTKLSALYDHLLATIEPRLRGEVTCDVEQHEAASVLAVRVKPNKAQQPYAQLRRRGGREFHLRVADRTREMTREELRHAFLAQANEDRPNPVEQEIKRLLDTRADAKVKHGMWCWLRPVPSCDVDLMNAGVRRKTEQLLRERELSGNRRMGWTVISPYYEWTSRQARLEGKTPGSLVRIGHNGALDFWLALDVLRWKEPGDVIYPYALLEFPTSMFRVAAKFWQDQCVLSEDNVVVAELSILGLRGWALRGGSPQAPFYRMREPPLFDQDHFERDEPIVFSQEEVLREPDRCAFRLVRDVYGEFGYTDAELPTEFDFVSGKLVLPD